MKNDTHVLSTGTAYLSFSPSSASHVAHCTSETRENIVLNNLRRKKYGAIKNKYLVTTLLDSHNNL